jgi:hypothetical protein
VSTVSEDDYADFFVQNFTDFSRDATYETVNGVQYTSRIVKSLALFAHQSGTYTLQPLIMNVGINAPFAGNQGFFTMRRIQDIQVSSEPLSITVLPLPSGAPPAFKGAVGQYRIRITSGNTRITTDEAIAFQVEISGNGDSRRWDAPLPVVEGEVDIYDPKILGDKLSDHRNQVMHIRTVSYQCIPAAPGEYKVFVPFTFFDPREKQYITITTDTIAVHVAQGQQKGDMTIARLPDEETPPPLMKVRGILLKDQFWTSVPHLLLFGLVVAGACLGLVVSYKRRKEDQLPASERIRAADTQHALSQFAALETKGE